MAMLKRRNSCEIPSNVFIFFDFRLLLKLVVFSLNTAFRPIQHVAQFIKLFSKPLNYRIRKQEITCYLLSYWIQQPILKLRILYIFMNSVINQIVFVL